MHSTAYRSLDAWDATRELEASIIDGQAWIVSATPTGKTPGSHMWRRRTPDRFATGPEDTVPGWVSSPGALAAFAARRRRRAGLDLFSQGAPVEPRGTSTAPRPAGAPATRRYAGVAAIGAFAILPLLLFAQPEQPIAAPIEMAKSSSGGPAREAGNLVIANLKTGITQRGGGDVLVLDGIVRNTSTTPAVLPPILVTLTGDPGSRLSKPLALKPGTLAPGQSIRFHSAVAVATGTKSDVVVAFLPSSIHESPLQ